MLVHDFTSKRMLVRHRTDLVEGPAGTFTTPEQFKTESLLIHRNGQALGDEEDNGVTTLDNQTFEFKESIDRNPSNPDFITVIYEEL